MPAHYSGFNRFSLSMSGEYLGWILLWAICQGAGFGMEIGAGSFLRSIPYALFQLVNINEVGILNKLEDARGNHGGEGRTKTTLKSLIYLTFKTNKTHIPT